MHNLIQKQKKQMVFLIQGEHSLMMQSKFGEIFTPFPSSSAIKKIVVQLTS
jgi:hypothetical protein